MNAKNALSRLKMLRAPRGMSLVEIMIVLAIIGLMASMVAFVAIPKMQEAREKTARATAGTIRQAIVSEQLDDPSACPPALELKSKKKIEGDALDPWAHPYKVVCDGDEVTVTSFGRDGKEGTEDDIVQPKPDKK